MKLLFITILMILSISTHAKDFGVEGSTYPIKEQNILEYIMMRLSTMQESGEIDRINEKFKERAVNSVMRPKPVIGISHTTENREYFYDPSITLSEAIITHDNQTIHPAGTRINPLDKVRFHYTFLFIDGDDPEHVQWALSHSAKSKKIILTSGPIIDLMREHGQRFYFDQGGKLTSKFGITHVPAQISQFGKHLLIKEVAI